MNTLNTFVDECQAVLHKAFTLFNIDTVKPADVVIDCTLKGKVGGNAILRRCKGTTSYKLKFNREAIEKYYDYMVSEVIPHEIAHIICFINPTLGDHHNAGWQRVCRSLGGQPTRCHSMSLTSMTTTYEYNVKGTVVSLSRVRHNRLQKGQTLSYTIVATGQRITKEMWVDYNQPIPVLKQAAFKPSQTTKNKKQIAQHLYRTLNGDRTKVIHALITQYNMTTAGANTYYYNCKKSLG